MSNFTLFKISDQKRKEGRNQKGFTLIELLVAITIFSLVGGMATGIFTLGLRAQRKSLATQELLNQTSYLMEYMSRALRMARKDLSGDCIDTKLNYKIVDSGIEFMNYKGECQKFYLSNNQLKEEKNGVVSDLTSSNLEVVKFKINLVGETQTDDLQPRVTISLEIQGKENSKIQIQTTLSQRNPDIQL